MLCLKDWKVLNAFRHQRLLHRLRFRSNKLLIQCAQRLSASKIAARSRLTGSTSILFSAQRLSASKIAAPCLLRQFMQCLMSAQRLSASKIAARRFCCALPRHRVVLNAFRHQRLLHPYAEGIQALESRCSTPFGIKDCCTSPGAPFVGGVRRVLNAFRHQRLLHGARLMAPRFDIRVLNAFRHQRLLHRSNWSLSWCILSVLNAFRHQRLLHFLFRC